MHLHRRTLILGPERWLVLVDLGALSLFELQIIDVAELVTDCVEILGVDCEAFNKGNHMWPEFLQQVMKTVLGKNMHVACEIATLVQTLRVTKNLLERIDFKQQVQDWFNSLVFKIVRVQILKSHVNNYILQVGLHHALHIHCIPLVRFLCFS
jgi:hypothetical protein